MSTKIYGAKLWSGTTEELMEFLLSLRNLYREEVTDILFDAGEEKLKKYAERFHKDQDRRYDLYQMLLSEIRKQERTPFNFDASIVVYFRDGKTVLVPFGIDAVLPRTKALFESDQRLKDFAYWNNTDPDETCTEEEWEYRGTFFDELFGDWSNFGTMGLVYELSNNETLFRAVIRYYDKMRETS